MREVVIPAFTVPVSRSHDGLDYIVPEQVITSRKQPRHCAWCAVVFVPRCPSGSRTATFCGKSCAGKMRRSLQPRTSQLREVVLEQVGRLTVRTSSEIRRRVVDVWGMVSDRAIHRNLAELRRSGLIVRVVDEEGYLLAPRPRAAAAEARASQ